jgi:hypothetical protein
MRFSLGYREFRVNFTRRRAHFVTHSHSHSLLTDPAPFRRLAPAFSSHLCDPSAPPAARLACSPASPCALAPQAGPHARVHQHGSHYLPLSGYSATRQRSCINAPDCISAAPFNIVLRAMHVISLGVHRKVHYSHVLRIPRRDGVPVSVGMHSGIKTSWRTGMTDGAVGVAFIWPIDKLVGRYLASLQLVGHLFRVLRERGGVVGVGRVRDMKRPRRAWPGGVWCSWCRRGRSFCNERDDNGGSIAGLAARGLAGCGSGAVGEQRVARVAVIRCLGCRAVHVARRRTSQTVAAMSRTDSASSQPPSIHWNGQNRLAGW